MRSTLAEHSFAAQAGLAGVERGEISGFRQDFPAELEP